MIPEIVKGDLLDQKVEVIVNAWNRNLIPWWLLLPQGVSGAIKRHGGTAPFREVAKAGVIPLGGAVLTGAGRLPFRNIIHVAGINLCWHATEYSIRQSVRSAMEIVKREDFSSVAFPAIGSGSGNGSPQWALALMLDEFSKIDSPAQVVIVEFLKYQIRQSHPLCGLRYLEEGREMRINSEMLMTRKRGIAIWKDSIAAWEPPHENEIVSDDDKERIFNNVLRHFQGWLIDTGDGIDPTLGAKCRGTYSTQFNHPESLLVYGENNRKISMPFTPIDGSRTTAVIDPAGIQHWDAPHENEMLTAEEKERLMRRLAGSTIWFAGADELWNTRRDEVLPVCRAIMKLIHTLPEYGLFRERRMIDRLVGDGLPCRAMLDEFLREATGLSRRTGLSPKLKTKLEAVSKKIETLIKS